MKLYPFQLTGIAKALEDKSKRWIFNDEMGLGKTVQAIEFTKARLTDGRVLVVCPAIVRSNWKREIGRWWEEVAGEVGLVWASRARKSGVSKKRKAELEKAYEARIVVVSYGLIRHVDLKGWDVIIFDECHRLKEPKTIQYRLARSIVQNNKRASIVGLTGTLMPNKPLDACGVVECIWPGRFGGIHPQWGLAFKTKMRYTNAWKDEYGWHYDGVNILNSGELKERLSYFSSRTTKKEVAHLLPPFTVEYTTIAPSSKWRPGKTVPETLSLAAMEKLPFALEWIKLKKEECAHVAVLTHLRETARVVAEELSKKYKNVYTITGNDSPEARNEILAKAAGQDASVVVATMHSIGIGIDLTFCTAALFVELYYRPETVVQALGRFSRLSGREPASVTMMALEDTPDETLGVMLYDKIEAINSCIDSGMSEQGLVDSLGNEDDLLTLLEETCILTKEDSYE